MNRTLNAVLKGLALIAFVISSIWLYSKPGYDSLISTITALSAFIALFFINTGGGGKTKMSQKAGDHSNLYQSGGPMTIN